MAINPTFISTPRIGIASLSTANTATDGTGAITDLITAVTSGTRILSINVQTTATTTASLVNVFVNDGSNYHLYDQITVGAATSSSTAKTYRLSTQYTDLVLPNANYKLGCTLTVAPSTGSVRVVAHGADLT